MKKKYGFMKTVWMFAFLMVMVFCPEITWASQGARAEVIGKFNSFESLLGDVISCVGTIYAMWGISEWGLSMHESNGTMGSQSFKRIAGGIVTMLAPQILLILT